MSASAKSVNFTNVKEGGNFNKKRIPSGDYLATITKVEDATAKDDIDQFLFTIKIEKHSSTLLPYYCKLQENQLWKLRNILIAAGKTVPKSKIKVDPNQIVNKKIGVTVIDSEWEKDGKVQEQSEIDGVFPATELADDAPIDGDDDESDDDDELEDDTLEDDQTEEEDEEEVEEEDDEPAGDEWDAITDRLELRKALKRVAPDAKTSTAMSDDDIRDMIRAASADEIEEEAPAPVKKKAPAAKAAPVKAPAKKKSTASVSDDELDELDLDDL